MFNSGLISDAHIMDRVNIPMESFGLILVQRYTSDCGARKAAPLQSRGAIKRHNVGTLAGLTSIKLNDSLSPTEDFFLNVIRLNI